MRDIAAPVSLPPRYRLDRPVASGGMASVWAAHDTLLDRPVAVKFLAEHLNQDVAARQRFQREARAAAGLSSHPGVVTIYDVGEHDGRSFMVMELLTGGTVADAMRRGERSSLPVALAWLRNAAEALDTAHERGIVHRDIKPANLLLDGRGRALVADFGIARLAWEEAVTQTGQVLGTAAYLSPEQAEGGKATAASDRYSMAVVAFELLTGRKPFEGEHFAAQARAHIEDRPPRATERDPSLPPAVDDVLARGLAKDPAHRWPSAVAFAEALERAVAGAGASPAPTAPTRPMTRTRPAPAAAAAAARPSSEGRLARAGGRRPSPTQEARRGMRLPLALAIVLLGLALLAIALGLTLGGDERDPASPEADRREQRQDQPREEPTQQPTAQASPAPEETEQAPAEPQGGDPAQLNGDGYALFQQGRYEESIPYFRQAVDACGDSSAVDPCGYALFNLGAALNRAGDPDQAIPILQDRLRRFDNQSGVVKKELKDACEAAGQGKDCSKVD